MQVELGSKVRTATLDVNGIGAIPIMPRRFVNINVSKSLDYSTIFYIKL